jgi:hypothetical protein
VSLTPVEPQRQAAIRLSNRQYGQLRAILNSPKATLTLEDLSIFNQLTLGANKRRGFVTETRTKDGVTITYSGRQALLSYDRADFLRQVSSMHFSSYLKLDTPEMPTKKKPMRREPTVRQFRRRQHAA